MNRHGCIRPTRGDGGVQESSNSCHSEVPAKSQSEHRALENRAVRLPATPHLRTSCSRHHQPSTNVRGRASHRSLESTPAGFQQPPEEPQKHLTNGLDMQAAASPLENCSQPTGRHSLCTATDCTRQIESRGLRVRPRQRPIDRMPSEASMVWTRLVSSSTSWR